MDDTIFFLESIRKKAKDSNNEKILKLVNSDSFYHSLSEVCNAFTALDLEIVDKSDSFDHEKEINLKISRALAQNYFVMYYVNIITDDYISYSKDVGYKALKIEDSGSHFFDKAFSNIEKVIHKDDVEYVRSMLAKDKVLEATKGGNTYSFTYRLILNGAPTYVTLTGTRLTDDTNNLIFGVANVDTLIKREIEYKKQMAKNVTYSNIALALASDFLFIYYVNISSYKYIEYSLDSVTQTLNVKSTGDNFFEDTKINVRKVIYPEDQEKFLRSFEKDTLLNEINKGTFKMTYRQLFNDKPVYLLLSCMKLYSDSNHMLVAISNIDAQKKRENEYKHEIELQKCLARTDALTGASNKYSYNEFEINVNEKISKGLLDQFAVLLCDINDLKKINDTLGHDAGDDYIRCAVNTIKSTFKNTTLFRIGGDEFVLILDGNDYYNREYLVKKLHEKNIKNMHTNKAIVACGMAEFIPNKDTKLIDVFKRADEAMYKDKKELKEIWA